MAIAGRLTAIELDRDLATMLRAEFTPERLTLIEGDALQTDLATVGPRLRVVGNLPYNISSQLLFHLIRFLPQIEDVHVMLQREVVDRMAAAPGSKTYGRLSVMLQARFAIAKLFDVPAGAFQPPPKVVSAVVRLTPHAATVPAIRDEAVFARVVSAAFGQRRKTLRNTWKGLLNVEEMLALAILPGARAETLSVTDYLRVADFIALREGSFPTRHSGSEAGPGRS